MATVEQFGTRVDIGWNFGEAIRLTFTVVGQDWTSAGPFDAQVRFEGVPFIAGRLLTTLDVQAQLSGSDTIVTLVAPVSASDDVPVGVHAWRMWDRDGRPLAKGKVRVAA